MMIEVDFTIGETAEDLVRALSQLPAGAKFRDFHIYFINHERSDTAILDFDCEEEASSDD